MTASGRDRVSARSPDSCQPRPDGLGMELPGKCTPRLNGS